MEWEGRKEKNDESHKKSHTIATCMARVKSLRHSWTFFSLTKSLSRVSRGQSKFSTPFSSASFTAASFPPFFFASFPVFLSSFFLAAAPAAPPLPPFLLPAFAVAAAYSASCAARASSSSRFLTTCATKSLCLTNSCASSAKGTWN